MSKATTSLPQLNSTEAPVQTGNYIPGRPKGPSGR
jgi:hypothetical protein